MAFEVINFRGGSRGGPRGGRGRGFGGDDRGGGRGAYRGFRGGDRGGRGDRGFRGGRGFRGDRGSRGAFRGSDRGSTRGGFGGGYSNESETENFHEIAHALQLRMSYKSEDVPTEKDVIEQYPGLHSRFQKATNLKDYFLLFKNVESLENAKVELEKDDAVDTVDYVGLRSQKYSSASIETRQVYLQFTSDQDEDSVKKLNSKIKSVEFFKEKTSCLAEFPTAEEGHAFIGKISGMQDRGSLKFARESSVMKWNLRAKASIQPNQIVVRDIPKKATLKELALLFPDANSVMLYNATFPLSDYCHASYRFENLQRVEAILKENKNPVILGKKVYVFPAYSCLLAEMPKLGEPYTGNFVAAKSEDAALVKDSKQSPSKKMKLEDDEEDDEDGEEEGGDEEEDDDEEEEEEQNGEDNMESADPEDDEEEDEEGESDD